MEKNYRLFLRNLPGDVRKKDLEKLLNEHGALENIDIKEKIQEDGSRIAFVNISTTDRALNTCFRKVNGAFIGNNAISIEIAKESYLDRLKREREEAANLKTVKEPQIVPQDQPIERINIKLPKNVKSKPAKRIYNFDDGDAQELTENHSESANLDFSEDPALQVETFPEKKIKIDNLYPAEKKVKVEKPREKKALGESEIKRLASVKKKVQNFRAKEQLISNALKSVDSKRNNKVIFSDDIDEIVDSRGKKSKSLFDDDDEEDQEDWNEEKFHHDEKRNAKLSMSLKNSNRDERFAIDERFLDDDDETREEKIKDGAEENELENETKWQLEILENVLGKPIKTRNNQFSTKKKNTMIRYDPLASDHQTHELEMPKKNVVKAKKTKVAKIEADLEETPVPVSSEVFYNVSENLTESLKPQEEFSLLKTFGTATTEDKNRNDEYDATAIVSRDQKLNHNFGDKNPFKYESSDDEDPGPSMDQLITGSANKINGNTKETKDTFFFAINDQRFTEAEEFFKRPSTAENFSNVRRELKQIVRSKIRNNVKKNTPWRNTKIGNRAKVR